MYADADDACTRIEAKVVEKLAQKLAVEPAAMPSSSPVLKLKGGKRRGCASSDVEAVETNHATIVATTAPTVILPLPVETGTTQNRG